VLEKWRGLLPPRIVDEDFRDYVERFRQARHYGGNWLAVGVAAEAVFATGVNAIWFWMTRL
jgi:hypothetical protein